MKEIADNIKNSLTTYSIFGYLLPGFFISTLLIIDYDLSKIIRLFHTDGKLTLGTIKALDLKTNYILQFFSSGTMSDFKIIPFIVFLLFCYLLGHVVSAFSSFVIERMLVKKLLGFPSTILLSNNKNPRCPLILGNYRRSFKASTQAKLTELVDKTFNFKVEEEDYYWLCYSYIITTRPYLASRIHHFVNLYGFSRNIASTFLIYIFFRLVMLDWVIGSKMDQVSWWIWLSYLVIALFMFWNYLKLFKRQAIDTYFIFMSVHSEQKLEAGEMERRQVDTGM